MNIYKFMVHELMFSQDIIVDLMGIEAVPER